MFLESGVLNGQKGLATYVELGWLRCIASFSLGVVVWFLFQRRLVVLPRVTQEFALVGALGTLFFFLHHTSAKTPHNAWAPLFFAAIIYLCAIDRGSLIKRVLETRPLKAIGRWSYSIYMVHMMFAVGTYQLVGRVWSGHITVGVFEDLVATPVWIGDLILVAYLGLVIAVSALTYAFVETPWREYGRRMCLKI